MAALSGILVAMVRDRRRERSRQLTPSGWVTLVMLGAALLGWVIMLFFDPADNEVTRIAAVLGALITGVVIGIARYYATAAVIVRVLGPLWRATLVVIAWVAGSFIAMVAAADNLLPAAHERAPLVTLTVMLILIGALAFIAVPFVPSRSMYTGTKTDKNAFEELKPKSYWRYAFFQYGGFFYGFAYTGAMLTALSFATVDPTDF